MAEEVRVGVVVEAGDRADTLTTTLNRVRAELRVEPSVVVDQFFVVDNGSRDDASGLARSWARRCPTDTTLIRYPDPVGSGAVRKEVYARAMARGLDVLVHLVAGDGADPSAIEAMATRLRLVARGECDAVTAARPSPAGLGPQALRWLQRRVLGPHLADPRAGFAVLGLRALRRLPLEYNSDGVEFDSQLLAQLVAAGARVVELTSRDHPSTRSRPSRSRPSRSPLSWRDTGRCARAVGVYWSARLGFGDAPWLPPPAGYAFKPADGTSHAAILDLVAPRAAGRVLDLGCSGGHLAEQLRAAGHHVTGVDVIEIPGARDRTDRLFLADLGDGIPDEVGSGYDVVIAGDVVEHLPRPLDTLRQIRSRLRPGGELLLSVPNVGHWYARGRVLCGRFGYDRRGILDETHLRFFTRGSLRRLLGYAGYDVAVERVTGLPVSAVSTVDGPRLRWLQRVDAALVRFWPALFGYQFVVRAVPRRTAAVVEEVRRRLAIESATLPTPALPAPDLVHR